MWEGRRNREQQRTVGFGVGTGERSGKRGRRSCLTLQLVREDIRGDVRVGLGGRVEKGGCPRP